MTRGNQRELARAKNAKKQGVQKACEKTANAGTSLTDRKHRDAERMREKQKAAEDKKKPEGASGK